MWPRRFPPHLRERGGRQSSTESGAEHRVVVGSGGFGRHQLLLREREHLADEVPLFPSGGRGALLRRGGELKGGAQVLDESHQQ